MNCENKIVIKNIYYMLTYAFGILRQCDYENIAAEEFENIQDMFAAILGKGVSRQIKTGLYKEYREKTEELNTLHGKMKVQLSIQNKLRKKQLLVCEVDELSENNQMNQILKTTMLLLLGDVHVKKERCVTLKRNLLCFQNVDEITHCQISWDKVCYHKNNQTYKMLLNICRFIFEGMIFSDETGQIKMAKFLDDQSMCRLYEKFILEYFRYHHPQLHPASQKIKWNLDNSNDMWLPEMITDITLNNGEKTLIIDAKYYTNQMQSNFDAQSFRNANLYQIFAYVKNMDVHQNGTVSGMLLYAKTQETMQPKNKFSISGNQIEVNFLDLSQPFSQVSAQLEEIVKDYFG